MSEFEFFFALFVLLLGLTLAEIALKFTDAIAARDTVRLGVLTPMLACFVLLDLAGFWMWTWSSRDLIHMNWPTVFGGLLVALAFSSRRPASSRAGKADEQIRPGGDQSCRTPKGPMTTG